MQKKIILLPIAAVLGLAVGIPGGMMHTHAVQVAIQQQKIELAKQKAAERLAAKRAKIAREKRDEALANKAYPLNVIAKNDQIKVNVMQEQTGQLLYTGGKKAKHRYVVFQIAVTNHGTSAIMFQRQDFQLKTKYGTVTQTAMMTKTGAIDKAMLNKPIAVGTKMIAYVAFDTKGANDKNKTLVITNKYNNTFSSPLFINIKDINTSDGNGAKKAEQSSSESSNSKSSAESKSSSSSSTKTQNDKLERNKNTSSNKTQSSSKQNKGDELK